MYEVYYIHTDVLSFVWLISNFQIRYVFEEFIEQLLGCKAHGCDIVNSSTQQLVRCIQKLKERRQTVFDVYHRQSRVRLQVALISFV